MTKVSVLNLVPHFEGETEKDAIDRATSLVSIVEKQGYTRYWVAEHHNFKGVLSSATDLIMQHLLANSSTIRLGAGGVMLPNHTTLQVAERFGTLATLYPDRIDLGLGRAPGTDQATARIIYRGDSSEAGFARSILELQRYFGPEENQGEVIANPGTGLEVPLYILGSSISSAYVAAEFGLPYSFASHFAPQQMKEALEIYRSRFKRSKQLAEPYVIIGVLGYGAETNEEAEQLFMINQKVTLDVIRGEQGRYTEPDENFREQLTSAEKLFLDSRMGLSLKGSPATIAAQWKELSETYQADEVIVVSYLPKLEQLEKSYGIIADVILNKA